MKLCLQHEILKKRILLDMLYYYFYVICTRQLMYHRRTGNKMYGIIRSGLPV